MRLRNNFLHIKRIDEPSVGKKVNIEKYIYLLLLSAFLVFILWKWGKGLLYVKGYGQIKISRLNVQAITGIRLLKIKVEEGDTVNRGDTLFTFTRYHEYTYGGTKDYINFKEDLMKLNYELKRKLTERNFVSTEIREKVKQLDKARKLLALKIGTEEEIDKIRKEIRKLIYQRNLINNEIKYLRTRLQNPNLIQNSGQTIHSNGRTYREVFRSPFSGIVTRIYFNNYEVALKGEKIMVIVRPGDIYIKGYFEQKDWKYLKTGDKVTIEFPDGSKTEGKISRLYYAALRLPPEFQKKYEPVHRNIVADIVPLNPNLISDKEVEKMSVTLWVKKNLFRREK